VSAGTCLLVAEHGSVRIVRPFLYFP